MRLEIEIPEPQQAIAQACPVPIAANGISWRESCLGKNAKETGVYVIHHVGVVKYVGKTDSPSMSYGTRLRREFQETASNGKHIYPKLAALTVPPDIMVSFFSAKTIDAFVKAEGLTLTTFGKIQIFEIALTHAYDPEFQRHHVTQVRRQLKKFGLPEQVLDVLNAKLKARMNSLGCGG